jgi:hypothetical protein
MSAIRPRAAFREIGTALALFAVYLLVVLAPLHQSRALQAELDPRSFASQICYSSGQSTAPDKNGTHWRCPACTAAGISGPLPAPVFIVQPFDILREPCVAVPSPLYVTGLFARSHAARAPPFLLS